MATRAQDDATPRPLRVAVIGAGVSGLAAARRIEQGATKRGLPVELLLIERTDRPGGLVRTERVENLVLEAGADSLVAQKPAALELCRELGLEPELARLRPKRHSMRIFHDEQLLPLPSGFALVAPGSAGPLLRSPLFSWGGKLRMLTERFRWRARGTEDESLRSFVERRFGREAYERLAEPILGGLYMADAEHLSSRLTLGHMVALEQRYGSVTRALRAERKRKADGGSSRATESGFWALRGGMERLVGRMVDSLPEGCLTTGRRIETIAPLGEATWSLSGGKGPGAVDAIVLACPSHAAASLVRGFDESLATGLAALRYSSCATINLVYDRKDIGSSLDSFGFFVPRTAELPILACSYMSEKFPDRGPRNRVVLRTFAGGALNPLALERNDDQLVDTSHEVLARLLDIRQAPHLARVHRFPRSMPHLTVGHESRTRRVRERMTEHRGLFLCGSALGNIGVPDCVASGHGTAQEVLNYLAADAHKLRVAI